MKKDLSSVPVITESGPIGATSKQESSSVETGYTPLRKKYMKEIICKGCGRKAEVVKNGKRTPKHCSYRCSVRRLPPVTKVCAYCNEEFSFRSSGKKNNDRRRFCSKSCSRRSRPPPSLETRKKMAVGVSRALKGKKAPGRAKKMRENNPTKDPEVRKKMSRALKGRTFLARGGNGKPTVPQLKLAKATGLPMEHAIATAPVRGLFPSLPPCYKVDLAHVETKTAIEVDGNSHKTRRWRFLDRRKTSILEALGWCVLRFWNEQVLEDLPGVVEEIRACTTLRSKETTIISHTES